SLVSALLQAIVEIGARASGRDKKAVWLAIVLRRRVVAVVMHSQLACRRVEVVREGNISHLPGRSANCYTRVCSTIGPHVSAWPIQYLDTGLVNPYRDVCICVDRRENQWMRKRRRGGCYCRSRRCCWRCCCSRSWRGRRCCCRVLDSQHRWAGALSGVETFRCRASGLIA